MYYLTNFIVFSILGFVFETLTAIVFSINSESGFMYGPYTIVYGIGVTLMFLLFKKFDLVLKSIYNLTMWNYSKLPLHIGKYLSIEVTTIWTLGAILIYSYIKPFTDKVIKKIPNVLSIGILCIMLLDLILTTLNSFS